MTPASSTAKEGKLRTFGFRKVLKNIGTRFFSTNSSPEKNTSSATTSVSISQAGSTVSVLTQTTSVSRAPTEQGYIESSASAITAAPISSVSETYNSIPRFQNAAGKDRMKSAPAAGHLVAPVHAGTKKLDHRINPPSVSVTPPLISKGEQGIPVASPSATSNSSPSVVPEREVQGPTLSPPATLNDTARIVRRNSPEDPIIPPPVMSNAPSPMSPMTELQDSTLESLPHGFVMLHLRFLFPFINWSDIDFRALIKHLQTSILHHCRS
jgi:hypothetical protein